MHKNGHIHLQVEIINEQLRVLMISIDDAYLPRDNDPARAAFEQGRIKLEEGMRQLLIPGGEREEGQ